MIESNEIEGEEVETSQCAQESEPRKGSGSRKEKRKAAKKEKRKHLRKELAEKARQEEEARLKDPEAQRRIQLEEEREIERLERERKEFEEREKLFLEELARKKAEEEEDEERRRALEEELKRNEAKHENESNEDNDWEYVEEGPPEIIWQGNEIIVKKNRVRVKKKDADQHTGKEDADRPTSNPLPPQSEAFADYQNAPAISAQQLLENVAQQVPNFGTEQDKAHCPFHIKTGACRFGSRCSRVHFYPDKSCTLLMKNMYNGPGLAWEQDEGLENSFYKLHRWRFKLLALVCLVIYDIANSYTDEEVDRCYEEFYEDVHTEFLKYGEIVNFKVCRNGAFHLRGNLYVHYKSSDSALMAFHFMNGRYFAGKQVKCEFVGVTRWKIAICGEFMKSRLKTCSRGTACNFIHCFRNPGGDYEWADWDKPPPRYWMNKMTALFGYSDESVYDKQTEQENVGLPRKSSKMLTADRDRYHFRRSRSREREWSNGRYYEDGEVRKSTYRHRLTSSDGQKRRRTLDEKNCKETNSKSSKHGNMRTSITDSDGDYLDSDRNREAFHDRTRKISRRYRSEVQELREYDGGSTNRTHESESDRDYSDCDADRDRRHDHNGKSSRDRKKLSERHGEPHDRTIDADKDWSELDRDEETHHDRTRKHRRHRHNKVLEYSEYHGRSNSRTHDTDSDGDLSDGDRKRERHHEHKRKSSRNMRKVSDVQNDFGNRSHGIDSDEDRLHEDDRDGHGRSRGSKRRKKVSEIYDDSRDNKNGAHAADSHTSLLIEDRYRPEE